LHVVIASRRDAAALTSSSFRSTKAPGAPESGARVLANPIVRCSKMRLDSDDRFVAFAIARPAPAKPRKRSSESPARRDCVPDEAITPLVGVP